MKIQVEDEMLYGLTSYQQAFGCWACPLKLVNIDPDNDINSTAYQRVKTGS